ncbi:NADPH:quinone reductase-like Zn-dependent oxidoreductase [Filimonas zeae]|uniref:NADPH:quinone reductase n=1 Tax=Filimonas zeae TaxID=1737353 RepID=A0A917MTY0_9BACT|nr:NADP-dependent oxidoreductase [Filimonas zeae]MDR6339363.1 NADPH:quinone reductase-like Zn-dependent oxidoreductase [Filimonas zeae]GGH63932.1 NADPH:quinone reductase [Filimonas zeae]
MKAIVLNGPGGVDKLEYRDLPIPEIAAGEVLVKVKAISINPVDVKVREGYGVYAAVKNANPIILGWDISGVVTESKSDLFKAGDEVLGMVNFPGHGKGYAEYVAPPAVQLALKPANFSFETAAATTLVALTAWQALVTNGKVQKGQRVLIHAGAGGVGHIAIQLAKHLGATVTATSSAVNKDFVLSLGVDRHIDYNGYNWSGQQPEYDFVLDTVGGDNVANSIAITKAGGAVVSIPSGISEALVSYAKEKGVHAQFMLVQSNGADMQQIAGLLQQGIFRPHIAHVFSFEQMREAHLQIATGKTVGKVVVIV